MGKTCWVCVRTDMSRKMFTAMWGWEQSKYKSSEVGTSLDCGPHLGGVAYPTQRVHSYKPLWTNTDNMRKYIIIIVRSCFKLKHLHNHIVLCLEFCEIRHHIAQSGTHHVAIEDWVPLPPSSSSQVLGLHIPHLTIGIFNVERQTHTLFAVAILETLFFLKKCKFSVSSCI